MVTTRFFLPFWLQYTCPARILHNNFGTSAELSCRHWMPWITQSTNYGLVETTVLTHTHTHTHTHTQTVRITDPPVSTTRRPRSLHDTKFIHYSLSLVKSGVPWSLAAGCADLASWCMLKELRSNREPRGSTRRQEVEDEEKKKPFFLFYTASIVCCWPGDDIRRDTASFSNLLRSWGFIFWSAGPRWCWKRMGRERT